MAHSAKKTATAGVAMAGAAVAGSVAFPAAASAAGLHEEDRTVPPLSVLDGTAGMPGAESESVASANRGPAGLPWLASTKSIPVAFAA